MLNKSKGPAMWSPRTQNDRMLFAEEWRYALESSPNLDFWQDSVNEIIIENNTITGVKTSMGIHFQTKAVIVTSGTFLNGVIHIGEKQFGGGRIGEKASTGITEQLVSLGFRAGRMKTGTPPRIDGRSLDYSKMEVQEGDLDPQRFSFLPQEKMKEQRHCWITYTNREVHDILATGFEKSPMFTGRITGTGPRYCPSIEDKITRFADKTQHQLFVEPEGWKTVEIYLNGFSTSLPEEVQYAALKRIPGFEQAKMFRPGYAIEYDFFPPDQLLPTLETKDQPHLYFAGQINGTTGYEEAACQGLIAGINAALKIKGKDPLVLQRDQAYIGVLIDDLITKSTDEPYRMFTSRAEYRTLLRQDNADERLTPLSHAIGLATDQRMTLLENKRSAVQTLTKFMDKTSVSPEEINSYLTEAGSTPIDQKVKLMSLLTRPQVSLEGLITQISSLEAEFSVFDAQVEDLVAAIEINAKYAGYLKKERDMADKIARLDHIQLSPEFNYNQLTSLSIEARQKLSKVRPATVGQASRISGVNPSDISIILIHLGR